VGNVPFPPLRVLDLLRARAEFHRLAMGDTMLRFVAGLVLGLFLGLVLAIQYPQQAHNLLDLFPVGR
jgi:hypothetical protein